MPKDIAAQKGLIFFQNVGAYGVKTITTESMKKFFRDNYNLSFMYRTISPELFLKKMITPQNIKELKVIKNIKSPDLSDNLKLGKGHEKEVRIYSRLSRAEKHMDSLFEKFRYVAGGKNRLFEYDNSKFDNVSVKVDIGGGKTRTIKLHNLDNLGIIEVIPDSIRMSNGHPVAVELINYFVTATRDYLNVMVLTVSR
ncbi:MAG: hypothetical protein FWE34_06245 [Defluviitaleaceae bacterium]|nr:hypothetical protein [Defluviitaleaceae bacterium]